MIINNDTVELLRECSAGIKMGISAIDEVISKVKSIKLGQILSDYRTKHEMLGKEAEKILKNCGEKTKEPNVIAKGMSWMKTNAMLYVSEKDSTVSDLITDGCNMGVKSVNKYILSSTISG